MKSTKNRLVSAPFLSFWNTALSITRQLQEHAEGISACIIEPINPGNPDIFLRTVNSFGNLIVERIFINNNFVPPSLPNEKQIERKAILSTFVTNPSATGKSLFVLETTTEVATNFIVTLDWEWTTKFEKQQEVLDNCADMYVGLFTKDYQ